MIATPRRPSRRYASVRVGDVAKARLQRTRAHVRHDGTEKVRYASQEAAVWAARLAMARSEKVPQLEAYQCHTCLGWHIGQSPRRLGSAHVDEALYTEIGERAYGCIRAENHPNQARARRAVRKVLGAVARSRRGRRSVA